MFKDNILGYYPFEDEFGPAVQGVSWATRSNGTFFDVGEWFGRGAKINIAGFIGLEHGTSRRVIEGTSTPWIYTYGRQLARVVEYAGYGFYSENELRQKIKESMTDPNVFN